MSKFIIKGLVEVTGPHDSGKSSLMMEYWKGNPQEIAMIDNDLKGQSTDEQLKNDGFPFGYYKDLRGEVVRKSWEQYYHHVVTTIDELEKFKPKVIIWDTWPDVFKSCKAYIIPRPKEFGVEKWSKDYIIRNGEQSREARRLEGWLINRMLNFADVLFISSHLKNHYKNNPKTGKGEQTGKEIPQTSAEIVTLSRLRIWLTRTPQISVPTGLILKNIDKKVYQDNIGLRTIPVLPPKVTPNILLPNEEEQPNDISLWDTIERYWNNPVGHRKLLAQETPTAEEKSIIDGTLTREQKIIWMSAITSFEQDKLLLEIQRKEQAKELKEAGKTFPQIAAELKLSVSEIVNLLKN